MSASLGRMTGTALPVIFVFAVVGVLSLSPLLRLVWAAFAPGGVVDFTLFFERTAKAATLRAAVNTVDTAFFGAVLALVIGVPFALLVAMSDMAGRKLAGFLLLLPLMV
ncbi:MAG TPA: iron ABC transporter permease, partial [Devosia sp.]|nr:iron ABC transporter permease [Devosia sp.]